MRTSFIPRGEPFDVLELTDAVHDALTAHSRLDDARFGFFDSEKLADAYRVAGLYEVAGDDVTVEVFVYKDKQKVGTFEAKGKKDKVAGLADDVLRGLVGALK